MSVKPYHFRLEKIKKEEQELLEGLLLFTPSNVDVALFHQSIKEALVKNLGNQILYYVTDAKTLYLQDYYSKLPDPSILGVLSLSPLEERAFVQFDPILAHIIVGKLLGEESCSAHDVRPLTPTEEGVLEFMILECLMQIHKLSGATENFHFRLDSLVNHPKEAKQWIDKDQKGVLLTLNVTFDDYPGFVKIYLPHPLLTKGVLSKGSKKKASSSIELSEKFKRIESTRLSLWGELGSSNLTSGDLRSLEAGDVILFDNTSLNIGDSGFYGEVFLRLGRGEGSGLVADWEGFDKNGECRVNQFFLGEL